VTGKSTQQRGKEEAPEKGKESWHSAHANGVNEGSQKSFFHLLLGSFMPEFCSISVHIFSNSVCPKM